MFSVFYRDEVSGEAVWDWDPVALLVYRKGFSERLNLNTLLVNSSDCGLEHLVHPVDLMRYRKAVHRFREGKDEHFEAEYRMRSRAGDLIKLSYGGWCLSLWLRFVVALYLCLSFEAYFN